ncbi:DUF4352 domain-containing protein [Bacillus sp. FJAT-29814]|uniref:DUF4352 domain-containing protein n=1 Tax=Bacillus sp. FJAT-29814 TaxID=1729688 RepID=UPI00082BE415|nr:DUF4352 domain-containing protein [Bacillus sp. FJAT-29814]
MKKWTTVLSSVLAISLLAACGNDEDAGKAPDSKAAETTAPAKDNKDNSSKTAEPAKKGSKLNLNQSAKIESTLGEYEMTVKSVKKIDEVEGFKAERDLLLELEVVVKNLKDKELLLPLLSDNRIINEKSSRGFDTLQVLDGKEDRTIEPNQTVTLNLAFDVEEASQYEFVHGNGITIDEVAWQFKAQ